MPVKDGINYRRAVREDVFPLMKLYQLACDGNPTDAVMLNYRALTANLESTSSKWLVAERDGELLAAFSMTLDLPNRLAKINRVLLDPQWKGSTDVLGEALPLLIGYLKGQVEVLYTTTRYLTLEQQEMTLQMGFKLLGIFPNAMGADSFRVNGLSAYFFEGLLSNRRTPTFKLHPSVVPFYELVARQCDLAPLQVYEPQPQAGRRWEPVPSLELLVAPKFVEERFENLKEKRSISIHFYPFQEPNALITGAHQQVEIFVKIIPEMRFAAIIGERLTLGVDPSALYQQVSLLLNRHGVTYIEMINDAGDTEGIDCLSRAGYLPVSYFPCFKLQGNQRRDYVILSRCFERLFFAGPPGADVNPLYLEYLTRYLHQDEKASLAPLAALTKPSES